jgi:hypothetical protein
MSQLRSAVKKLQAVHHSLDVTAEAANPAILQAANRLQVHVAHVIDGLRRVEVQEQVHLWFQPSRRIYRTIQK